jgi:hypothetical protein
MRINRLTDLLVNYFPYLLFQINLHASQGILASVGCRNGRRLAGGAGHFCHDESIFSHCEKRIAMVGTGVRGLGMWGAPVIKEFGDIIQFVGLCDINPGRVATGRNS